VRVTAVVLFRLSAFLAVAGLVYIVTSGERSGGSMMLVAAVAFTYIGFILRTAAHEAEPGSESAEAAEAAEAAVEKPPHVGPTIWPFVFSLAAIGFTLGIVVARWLLVAGAAVFVASTIGWFVDIRRQRDHGHQV
jgi:Cytochrome c oxidase subunit IV